MEVITCFNDGLYPGRPKNQVSDKTWSPAETPMKEAAPMTDVAPAAPAPKGTPKYLGKFKNAKNDVDGDIFLLDESTIYIQGFSFDGQAPDVYFFSDGVKIPYYTRWV